MGVSPVDRDDFPRKLGAPASTQNTPETETGAGLTAILERIAAALNVAPNAFARPDGPDAERIRILVENTEALEIFARITDRDARQRGLAYLRWIACNSAPEKGLGG